MKFNTRLQHLKYLALREVAQAGFEGRKVRELKNANNGRIKKALGGDKENCNIIQVVEEVCNNCPSDGFYISEVCRGCTARHCMVSCKFNAITTDENGRSIIDKAKCVNCGACAKACKYGAVISRRKPCQSVCKVGAISEKEGQTICINNDKCISCGACVANCPFGAIVDTSDITKVVDLIKTSNNGEGFKLYAMVAPSIAGQFGNASVGQIARAIKIVGFSEIVETALGADMVSIDEAKELSEKGFLLSSCCPAFVDYVKKNFPDFEKYISRNLSPMGTLGRYLKEQDNNCKIVFIGPCTAKKMEIKSPELVGLVDVAITFEELLALFDAKGVKPETLRPLKLENASYFGRRFAKNCGLSEAVKQSIKEQEIKFEVKPILGNGIEGCKLALLKARAGILDANFIEGMACEGGCVGGPCVITNFKYQLESRDYFDESKHKKITDAVLESSKKNVD